MAGSSSLRNITIAVPSGTTVYQNPPEICTPASWMDILLFYLANYVAHLGTIRVVPGLTWLRAGAVYISCFFFPLVGLQSALDCILHCVIFSPDDLQRAARAGALCMVNRGQGQGQGQGIIPGKQRKMTIPKEWQLPIGYIFEIVPRDALIDPPVRESFKHEVRYRWDWFKILLSIVQLLYSVYSLYKVTQHQLIRFGYAAFGLTVAPYALMGLLNLLANLLTPEFDEIYLVSSTVLYEALQYSGLSDKDLALVGRLVETDEKVQHYEMVQSSDSETMLPRKPIYYLKTQHPLIQRIYWLLSRTPTKRGKPRELSHSSQKRYWFLTFLSLLVVGGVYGIVYIMSRANPGQSTTAERVWTMGWLLCGSASPFVVIFLTSISNFLEKKVKSMQIQSLSFVLSLLYLFLTTALVLVLSSAAAFPVGGVVAVGQMMWAFGSCTVLS